MDASISHMTSAVVIAEARLRARNQLTLPEPIIQAAGIHEGDRFIVEVLPDAPGTLRLHRIRSSYASALRDVYHDTAAYLDTERDSWD